MNTSGDFVHTFRMLIVASTGAAFALPAGPVSDLVLSEYAKKTQGIDKSLCVLHLHDAPIDAKAVVNSLAGLGIGFSDVRSIFSNVDFGGAGELHIGLVDKGADEVLRVATALAKLFPPVREGSLRGAKSSEIASVFESWEIDRSAGLASLAPSPPRI